MCDKVQEVGVVAEPGGVVGKHERHQDEKDGDGEEYGVDDEVLGVA